MTQETLKKNRKANIGDVALEAGVSKSTVSNFLNQRNSRFSDETKEKIRKAMEKLRYIPDPGAQGIKSQGGGKTIGIILRKVFVNADYYHQSFASICETLPKYGYRALIIPDSDDFEQDVKYLRELAKGLIAGYFLFNISEKDDQYVNALNEEGIKFVCVGYNRQIDNFVASRHDNAWEEATRHLIERHGAKRIAILPGTPGTNVQKDRIRGYRSALDEAGKKYDESLVLHYDGDEKHTLDRLKKLLHTKNSPDSVILPHSAVDNITEALFELGLRVPKDLRIVVYDAPFHMEGRQYASIRLRLPTLGREAVTKMMALLKNDSTPKSGVFIDADFIPGRSCGCSELRSIRKNIKDRA